MSSQSTPLNNGQQAIVHSDLSRIFVGDNKFIKGTYNNSAYSDLSLAVGQVLGRVAATGWLKECNPAASDGSQFPIGVLAEERVIAGGDTVELYICTYGKVVPSALLFAGGGNLDNTVSSRRVRDWMQLAGFYLIPSNTEMSAKDNE
ncbi:MAG: head decoration protein [Burkholderiaceae bacterium]|nr:head decoration protein [Burkholderiaceae bacterium]